MRQPGAQIHAAGRRAFASPGRGPTWPPVVAVAIRCAPRGRLGGRGPEPEAVVGPVLYQAGRRLVPYGGCGWRGDRGVARRRWGSVELRRLVPAVRRSRYRRVCPFDGLRGVAGGGVAPVLGDGTGIVPRAPRGRRGWIRRPAGGAALRRDGAAPWFALQLRATSSRHARGEIGVTVSPDGRCWTGPPRVAAAAAAASSHGRGEASAVGERPRSAGCRHRPARAVRPGCGPGASPTSAVRPSRRAGGRDPGTAAGPGRARRQGGPCGRLVTLGSVGPPSGRRRSSRAQCLSSNNIPAGASGSKLAATTYCGGRATLPGPPGQGHITAGSATTASSLGTCRYYVTTPIYYVNDAPHIGHAYTTVIADALARWHRLLGDDIFFLTGTDEHGLKIQRSAEANGLTPKEMADRTTERFREAWELLDISYDDFIRTTEPRHHLAVQAFLQRVYDNGHIELGTYEGLYCVSCEAYYTTDELVDGLCPIHAPPGRAGQGGELLLQAVTLPAAAARLVRGPPRLRAPGGQAQRGARLIRGGLQDISISRTSITWGVPLPWDAAHVIYVWYDALINYATAIGYGHRRGPVRHLVAHGAPPHRQGHPALPLRVLAGDAPGGGDRPPAESPSTASCWSAARR